MDVNCDYRADGRLQTVQVHYANPRISPLSKGFCLELRTASDTASDPQVNVYLDESRVLKLRAQLLELFPLAELQAPCQACKTRDMCPCPSRPVEGGSVSQAMLAEQHVEAGTAEVEHLWKQLEIGSHGCSECPHVKECTELIGGTPPQQCPIPFTGWRRRLAMAKGHVEAGTIAEGEEQPLSLIHI